MYSKMGFYKGTRLLEYIYLTVGRSELPDSPIYGPEDSQDTVSAPEWGSLLSIVDGFVNPEPVFDLDHEGLKEVMAENGRLIPLNLKKRSDCSSVTITVAESHDELETAAVLPPMADSDNRLREIPCSIPPVTPEVWTLKHSAFLAQLLMEEVDLESTSVESYEHTSSPNKLPFLNTASRFYKT